MRDFTPKKPLQFGTFHENGHCSLGFSRGWQEFSIRLCSGRCEESSAKGSEGCDNFTAFIKLVIPKGSPPRVQVCFRATFPAGFDDFEVKSEHHEVEIWGGVVRKAKKSSCPSETYYYEFEGEPVSTMRTLASFLDGLNRCGGSATGLLWFNGPLTEVIQLQLSAKAASHA